MTGGCRAQRGFEGCQFAAQVDLAAALAGEGRAAQEGTGICQRHDGRPAVGRCGAGGNGVDARGLRGIDFSLLFGLAGSRHLEAVLAGLVDQAVNGTVAAAQHFLLAHQGGNLGLHRLLVEQLAGGDAVDARAQGGDTVLVFVLHAGLADERAGNEILAEGEIGRRTDIACHEGAEQDGGKDQQVGRDAVFSNLAVGGDGDPVFPASELTGLSCCIH